MNNEQLQQVWLILSKVSVNPIEGHALVELFNFAVSAVERSASGLSS